MSDNTITRDTFNTWTAAWKDETKRGTWEKNHKDRVNFFNMPLDDFTAALKEKNIDSINLHLGLVTCDNSSNPEQCKKGGDKGVACQYEIKLIIVGVDKDGNELLDDGIYDLSQPCPPLCKE